MVFLAISALLGLLAIFVSFYVSIIFFSFFFLWLILWRKVTAIKSLVLLAIFLLLLGRGWQFQHSNHSELEEGTTTFSITFTDASKVDGDRWNSRGKELRVKEELVITYKIKTEEEKHWLENKSFIGETCKVEGVLKEPNIARNENAFDYKKYLSNDGIHWILTLENIPNATCKMSGFNMVNMLKVWREKGIQRIETYFPTEIVPIASALIFGDREWMEEDLQLAYQRLGIVHLLAISGSHIVVLVGIIYYLLIRIGVTREKSSFILMIILPCYAILTGLGPSVIRAVLTSMLLLMKVSSPQLARLPTIDILSIVFILYLLVKPSIIFDIGFLLSFTVSYFLIISSNILRDSQDHPLKTYLFTTFISEYSVLPILLTYFYEIPTLSLLANLVYIPFFSVLVLPYVIVLYFLSYLLLEHVIWIVYPLSYLLTVSDFLVRKISSFPFSVVILGKPTILSLLLYITSLPIFFYCYETVGKKKKRWLYSIPIGCMLFHFVCSNYSSEGEITFIDVGQGDSALVRLPFNKGTYLIDTGGTLEFEKEKWQVRRDPYEVGRKVLVPFLKSKGISEIDKLILTHGDIDHIGGSVAVLKELKVKEILMPKVNKEYTSEEKEIFLIAQKKRIPIQFVGGGDYWKKENADFTILSPIHEEYESENNGSIVLLAKIAGLSWLFTGDLEQGGELDLVNEYPSLEGIDILKVGHHGSKTSTSAEFIDKLKPKMAIISVGVNNLYQHPSEEVLKVLDDNNVKVLRTDQNGGISFFFSKKIRTFRIQIP